MRVEGTFTTKDFCPSQVECLPEIQTGLPTSVSTMEKIYSGDIVGRSGTFFTAAFDPSLGCGSYIALDSFEGALGKLKGAFNFIHSAATTGKDRTNEFFSIVVGSGTDNLAGISGTGGMEVDVNGTHHIWFDFEINVTSTS